MTLATLNFRLLVSMATMVALSSPAIASTKPLDKASPFQKSIELTRLNQQRDFELSLAPVLQLSSKRDGEYQSQQLNSNSSSVANRNNSKSSGQDDSIETDPSALEPPSSVLESKPPNRDGGTQTNESSQKQTGSPKLDTKETALPPGEQARQKLIIEADQLYQSGKRLEAEALYRQAKTSFSESPKTKPSAEPIRDPAQLPPGGRVYWRETKAGLDLKLKTRIFVPLRLLVKEYPEFIPGHLQLAEALVADQKPKEALVVMERAASLYPNQPELQKGLIEQQTQSKKWLEASITARQFALLNPDHPQTPGFLRLSDEYQDRFRSRLRTQITNNTIGSFITGAIGIAITGSPLPGLSALQTSILLLRGETAVGKAVADRAKRQLPLIEDPKVQAYVDGIGQKLTPLGGREFNYQFYVVNDPKLNAFALPGGKVFVNGGAILKSKSEAELAGLIAHELSHAVLSHGFQLATESSEAGGVARLIPYVGSLFANLVVADYSRDMEKQADILGTRLLSSAHYAADGLRNLMVTLGKEDKPFVAPWFSSHPGSQKRVRYLERLIVENGYNRYAYEGIEEHQQIQGLVRSQLKKDDNSEEERDSEPQTDSDTSNDTKSDTKNDTETKSSPTSGEKSAPTETIPEPTSDSQGKPDTKSTQMQFTTDPAPATPILTK